jgi:hypothetical protein
MACGAGSRPAPASLAELDWTGFLDNPSSAAGLIFEG